MACIVAKPSEASCYARNDFYNVEVYEAASNDWLLVCKQKSYISAMKMAEEAKNSVYGLKGGKRIVRVSQNGETVHGGM